MDKLSMFFRLTKVDEAKRQVSGILAQEVADRSKEIFDYERSKPNFQKWSESISKATEGKSVGNLRAMHGKVCAGKFVDIIYDDAAKAIHATAEVVDDAEWEKCVKGCYTGFSIGGSYVEKWVDPDNKALKRYEADPAEGSLVDLPCIPTATFSIVKADGMTEERAFTKAEAAKETDPPPEDGQKAAKDASDAADGASAEADEKDTPTAHAQAADAHDKAKDAHMAAGNKKTAGTHGKLAAFHRQAAKDKMPKQKSTEEEAADKAARTEALKKSLLNPELTNGDLEKLAAECLPEAERTGTTIELMARLGALAGITAETEKVAAREDTNPKEGADKYGDVKFADEKNKKYPIDTAAHIRAAWNYINKAKNAAKYDAEDVKVIKGKIVAAWKSKIDKEGPPSAQKVMETALQKDYTYIEMPGGQCRYVPMGLDAVAYFAGIVQSLWNAYETCCMEQKYEGDESSELPLRLEALATEAGEILCEMAEEETQEEVDEANEKAAGGALVGALRKTFVEGKPANLLDQLLAKAGARHSKEDMGRLQKIHDHSVEMGADCAAGKAAGGDLTKFKEAGTELMAISKLCGCAGDAPLDAITKAVTVMAGKAAKWDAAPAAPRGVLKSITKGQDAQSPTAVEIPEAVENLIKTAQDEKASPEDRAMASMRLSQMAPMVGAPVPAARR